MPERATPSSRPDRVAKRWPTPTSSSHQPLTGDGTITAQVTSLTGVTSTNPANVAPSLSASQPGLAAWAKAGILLTPSTRQGAAYAAVMATGSHGLRFQYDYTHDSRRTARGGHEGNPALGAPDPTGDTITGYDSTNGHRWTEIGISAPVGTAGRRRTSGCSSPRRVDFHGSSGISDPSHRHLRPHHRERLPPPHGSWHGHSIGTGPNLLLPDAGRRQLPPLRPARSCQRLR